MFAGCFSWCRLHMPWGPKKRSTETKLPEKPESPLAIVPVTTFAENCMEPEAYEILPQNSQSVVPTKKDYDIATVKEVLTLSQSAASVIPIPFLNEAIEVALKIIQVCEEASDVEQKLKELQARVGNLMIVIVDHVTLNDEENAKVTIVQTAEGIGKDIEGLLRILVTIKQDLTKISAQNRWVIAAYKQTNLNAIENCINRLSTAVQKFTLAYDLRDSAHISELHARLCTMANKVDDIHYKVDDIHTILFKLKRSGTRPVSEPELYENLPETSQSVVPTKTDYAIATVKEVLTLSQSAASVIPVPFLNEAIQVTLKIIQVCEESSDVDEQKLKELQNRVGDLMIVIVDHVTLNDEENAKVNIVQTAEGIGKDIEGLLRILGSINKDLTKISAQNRWVKAAYKQTNLNVIEKCMNRLSTAMQKFTLANDLRDSARIRELNARLRSMANKVDDIHYKVDDIHTFLFKLKRSGTRPVSDTFARQEMPLKPDIFQGRDDMVEDIVKLLLHEDTSRVCILGAAGTGKTSLSLAVVESPLIDEQFPGGNIVWVPCIEATSATVFLDILYIQLQVPGDKQVTLEKIISELNTLKQPRLIVFDNFETPWNGNQKQVGDILHRLAKLSHIAILVTMRGKHPPCHDAIKWQSKDIQSTIDEAASLRIYHEINPDSKDDPDVARLLLVLRHMPFAITLMAKLGLETRSSAKDLLDAWSDSGPDLLSRDPEQSMNRSIELSVESNLVKQNPNAIPLLAILSLLPAGTTKENLHWWVPADKMLMIPSAIATLSQAALLVENKRENSASPNLFVVPVVQSFMQQQNRIAQEVRKEVHMLCCEYVLTHACRDDDPTFPDKSKALRAEDTNIQSILFGSPQSQLTVPSHRNMEAFIAFNWYHCDTKPNLEIADHVVIVAKASGVQNFIASAVWCLGNTYSRLGIFDTAYSHYREAYQLFNTLPPGEVESQRLGGLCGIDFVNCARFTLPTDEVVSLAWDVETKCSALSDDFIHGRSLLELGKTLYDAKQWQEALYYLEQAGTVFKAAGNTYNLARAYQFISWVHHGKHRLPDALDAIEEAWKYAELTDSQYTQSSISLDLGRTLFSTNQDTKAQKYIERAIINASYIGDRVQVARAFDYLGYGYLRRGDYKNAYGAYEAAAEKYSGTTVPVESCKDNMSRIERKQRNPDEVIGFHRPSLEIDKTLFYPAFS